MSSEEINVFYEWNVTFSLHHSLVLQGHCVSCSWTLKHAVLNVGPTLFSLIIDNCMSSEEINLFYGWNVTFTLHHSLIDNEVHSHFFLFKSIFDCPQTSVVPQWPAIFGSVSKQEGRWIPTLIPSFWYDVWINVVFSCWVTLLSAILKQEPRDKLVDPFLVEGIVSSATEI